MKEGSLNEIQLLMKAVSPMFVYGAPSNYQSLPELRGAPFKGQLRYWFRALNPGLGITDLKTREAHIFGSTEVGSRVKIIVMPSASSLKIGNRYYLPHKIYPDSTPRDKQKFSKPAILENEEFLMRLQITHQSSQGPFLKAFLLWLNLGGVGFRARRGFGSLRAIDPRPPHQELEDQRLMALLTQTTFSDANQLVQHLQQVLSAVLPNTPLISNTMSVFPPSARSATYPSYSDGKWCVLVCEQPFNTYEDAMKKFWRDNLRINGIRDDKAFGYGKRGRRASPLHVHISQTDAGYHLVLTAFNSLPQPTPTFWDNHYRLFESCLTNYGGQIFTYMEEGGDDA
jgi:CRISPR-associated protein Cmr1